MRKTLRFDKSMLTFEERGGYTAHNTTKTSTAQTHTRHTFKNIDTRIYTYTIVK